MDFAKAMEDERSRLNNEKDILAKKIEVLKTAMAGLDKELKAIAEFKRAKSGGASTGTRRTSIRQTVLDTITNSKGMSRAQVLEALDAKGNKKATKSVSNALANLKKQGRIRADAKGKYKRV
jgi:hypothetical protein